MAEAQDLHWQAERDRAIQATAEGRFEKAETIYTSILDYLKQIVGDDEYTLTILQDLISLYDHYAAHLRKEQRAFLRQGLENRDAMRRRGRTIHRLYHAQLACYQQILNLQERTFGSDHLQLVDTLLAMARLHWDQFNEFDVFPFEWRALVIREHVLGVDHPQTLALVRRLALGHGILIAFATAAPLWYRVLEQFDRRAAARDVVDIEGQREALRELGKAHNALNDYVAAERVWRRYLDMPAPDPPKFEPDSPYYYINALDLSWRPKLDGLYGAGRACSAQGKWSEAALLLSKALALHRQYPEHSIDEEGGATQLGLDAGLHDYANVLRQQGRHDEALPLFEEALGRNQQRGLRFAKLLRDYALALRELHRTAEALALELRATATEATLKSRYPRRRDHGICANI